MKVCNIPLFKYSIIKFKRVLFLSSWDIINLSWTCEPDLFFIILTSKQDSPLLNPEIQLGFEIISILNIGLSTGIIPPLAPTEWLRGEKNSF